jgi:hypothetical protein
LRTALEPSVGAIAIDAMRCANAMVDRDEMKASPRAAAAWLAAQGAHPQQRSRAEENVDAADRREVEH